MEHDPRIELFDAGISYFGGSMTEEEKRTCFIIGPIGKAGTEIRKNADFLLKGIIRPAVEKELNLRIWRADEDSRPGMITDKVINDINDSDLIIADLSELNPNAFYELGIRHAADKPSIHMASIGTDLPFDNLGHRAIFFDRSDWDNIEAAKRELLLQCKQALEPDFKTSNPVTQALSAKAFRASADPAEKSIAVLDERIRQLEKRQQKHSSPPASEKADELIDAMDIFREIAEKEGMEYEERYLLDAARSTLNYYSIDFIKKLYFKKEYNTIYSILQEKYIPF